MSGMARERERPETKKTGDCPERRFLKGSMSRRLPYGREGTYEFEGAARAARTE